MAGKDTGVSGAKMGVSVYDPFLSEGKKFVNLSAEPSDDAWGRRFIIGQKGHVA